MTILNQMQSDVSDNKAIDDDKLSTWRLKRERREGLPIKALPLAAHKAIVLKFRREVEELLLFLRIVVDYCST